MQVEDKGAVGIVLEYCLQYVFYFCTHYRFEYGIKGLLQLDATTPQLADKPIGIGNLHKKAVEQMSPKNELLQNCVKTKPLQNNPSVTLRVPPPLTQGRWQNRRF